MLTLTAYARYVRASTPGRYAAVVLVYAAALLAKPMAVTLPVAPCVANGRSVLSCCAHEEIGGDARPESQGPTGARVRLLPPGGLDQLFDLSPKSFAKRRGIEPKQYPRQHHAHAGSGRPRMRFARAMPTRRSIRLASAIATCLPNVVMR